MKLRNRRIAVTGATGYLGQRLVKHLRSQGAIISILTRSENPTGYKDQPGIRFVQGTLSDSRILDSLVKNSDIVFHLAAYVHKQTVSQKQVSECFEVNLNGTRRLIDACIEQSSPPFFVFISSTAVYGSANHAADEETFCKPDTAYGHSKLEAERYLLDSIASGELCGCVLRPSAIYGEEAPGNITRMMKMVKCGFLPLLNEGKNLKSITYVDSVVNGVLLAAQCSDVSNGEIYNITDDRPYSIAEIGHKIASSFDINPLELKLPIQFVMILVTLWDRIARLLKGKTPFLKRSLEVYTGNNVFLNAKIKKQLNFQQAVFLEEGIQRMVKHYQQKY